MHQHQIEQYLRCCQISELIVMIVEGLRFWEQGQTFNETTVSLLESLSLYPETISVSLKLPHVYYDPPLPLLYLNTSLLGSRD